VPAKKQAPASRALSGWQRQKALVAVLGVVICDYVGVSMMRVGFPPVLCHRAVADALRELRACIYGAEERACGSSNASHSCALTPKRSLQVTQ